MLQRGMLIAFEGLDWSGKFTQLHLTKDWLEELGYRVSWAAEPNDRTSPIGIAIREMLQGKRERPADPFEFQRLYVIDRAQNLFNWYLPYLEGHPERVYLLERYALSTLAYGMLGGRPAEDFIKLHEDVVGPRMLWPDVTVLIDLPAEDAIRRIAKAREEPEHFEKLPLLKQVRENYLKARYFKPFQKGAVVVDGASTKEKVFEDVKAALEPLLTPLSRES